MRKARTHSNPFEIIKGVFFQNRAAMKMAEIDAIFDFMFTSPKDRSGASLVKVGCKVIAKVKRGTKRFRR